MITVPGDAARADTPAGILRTKTETAFVTIMQTAAAGDMAAAEAWGMDVAGFSARLFGSTWYFRMAIFPKSRMDKAEVPVLTGFWKC